MSYQQKRGKNTSWKNSLMKNLATELIIYEKLELLEKRAKDLSSYIDKLITLGKRKDIHSRRIASRFLCNINFDKKETALQKLFNNISKKYKNRDGGYTRILKLNNRKGDNSLMAIIEFV